MHRAAESSMAIEREDRINSVADAECPQILASNVLRPERDQLVDLLVVALGSALTCEVRRKRFILRSEEHTSELQSLMRISYAVFCLKKKNTTITKTITTLNIS